MGQAKLKPTILSVQWDRVLHHAEEGDVEETLAQIGRWMRLDRELYEKTTDPHPAVLDCLKGAEESCYTAAFNFYASTK